ncbi:hypothetical protein [Streptosporangium jomthongense]|uniref:Molecular chaperone DnaJ n=1 Tax=Streptosporangium jomthongense TaxID=1193683 RepID=A0ABV8F418_9ACTN
MAENDESQEPPICGTCLGAQGEWISRNGTGPKQSVWVACKSCKGTGRK